MWKCQLTTYWQQHRRISERLLSLRRDPAIWAEYSIWKNCHAIICFAFSMSLLVTCFVQSLLLQAIFHLGWTFIVVERGNNNLNEMKWYKIEIISIMWSDILLLCRSSHSISIKIKFIVCFFFLFFRLTFFILLFLDIQWKVLIHFRTATLVRILSIHIHFCWVNSSILRPFVAFFYSTIN